MSDPFRPAQIAVIIVNYRTADLTAAAVESVLHYYRGNAQVEVHVVDNASPGDDAATLARTHSDQGWGPQVMLYPQTANRGFGCGNNVVLRAICERAIPPDFAFLLNPDARLKNDAIALLMQVLEKHPKVGFVGAGIQNDDGTTATSAFRFPNALNTFVEAVNFGPLSRPFSNKLVSMPRDTKEGRVDWVSGAAFMIRLDALKDVRLFDEDFFLYFEEVELMHRAANKGWLTYFAPNAKVIHVQSAATGMEVILKARSRRPNYWYDSWTSYFDKVGGKKYILGVALTWLIGATLDHVIARLRRRIPQVPLFFYRDLSSAILRKLLVRHKPPKPLS
ncbi:glycosyltransferase family 2 protein [Loktanella sp. DJP18]|uniref:glycosyltransferase family 2 protein n=1 Tax=Loktanella sp. DJP18 TaxID=3409788 RepID=UPI003BB4A9A0